MESSIYMYKSADYSKRIHNALLKIKELRDEIKLLRSEVKYWRGKQDKLNQEAFKTV